MLLGQKPTENTPDWSFIRWICENLDFKSQWSSCPAKFPDSIRSAERTLLTIFTFKSPDESLQAVCCLRIFILKEAVNQTVFKSSRMWESASPEPRAEVHLSGTSAHTHTSNFLSHQYSLLCACGINISLRASSILWIYCQMSLRLLECLCFKRDGRPLLETQLPRNRSLN